MRLQFGTNGTAASGITSAGIDNSSSTGRKSASAGSTGGSDHISLSTTSSIINRDAVSRSDRIQQLSLAVQSGAYRVSSSDVGASIVSAALSR